MSNILALCSSKIVSVLIEDILITSNNPDVIDASNNVLSSPIYSEIQFSFSIQFMDCVLAHRPLRTCPSVYNVCDVEYVCIWDSLSMCLLRGTIAQVQIV